MGTRVRSLESRHFLAAPGLRGAFLKTAKPSRERHATLQVALKAALPLSLRELFTPTAHHSDFLIKAEGQSKLTF